MADRQLPNTATRAIASQRVNKGAKEDAHYSYRATMRAGLSLLTEWAASLHSRGRFRRQYITQMPPERVIYYIYRQRDEWGVLFSRFVNTVIEEISRTKFIDTTPARSAPRSRW